MLFDAEALIQGKADVFAAHDVLQVMSTVAV
jgi:hypothetical protein